MRPSRLLILLALALVPSLWGLARAATGSPEPAAGGQTWFNEEIYELLGMDGDWRVLTTPQGVRFRPVGGVATVELLELDTGAVEARTVPVEGEVAFGHGWIVVNETDQQTF